MKIYILSANPNYLWLETPDSYFDFFWKLLDSKPIGSTDSEITWKTKKDKKELTLGDFPFFMVPVVSSKAYNLLKEYFGNSTEIFPFAFNKKYGQFYFINVINILNVLDVKNSKIKYFSDGNIMRIENFVFISEILSKNTNIFKVQGIERGEVFVNEETKQLIESAGLEGFIFTQVWDSEDPDFVYEPRKIF